MLFRPRFLSVSSDGRILVFENILDGVAQNRNVHVWDTVGWLPIPTSIRSPVELASLALDPTSRTLAGEGNDGRIRLWDVTSGEDLLTLEGHAGGGSDRLLSGRQNAGHVLHSIRRQLEDFPLAHGRGRDCGSRAGAGSEHESRALRLSRASRPWSGLRCRAGAKSRRMDRVELRKKPASRRPIPWPSLPNLPSRPNRT